MDEGRKRVIGIIAGIIMARNLDRADDLFGGPQGSPRTDKMIAAAVQWADRIMQKIDSVYSDEKPKSVAQKA
jgi:broad specificity phosphatase PhoE